MLPTLFHTCESRNEKERRERTSSQLHTPFKELDDCLSLLAISCQLSIYLARYSCQPANQPGSFYNYYYDYDCYLCLHDHVMSCKLIYIQHAMHTHTHTRTDRHTCVHSKCSRCRRSRSVFQELDEPQQVYLRYTRIRGRAFHQNTPKTRQQAKKRRIMRTKRKDQKAQEHMHDFLKTQLLLSFSLHIARQKHRRCRKILRSFHGWADIGDLLLLLHQLLLHHLSCPDFWLPFFCLSQPCMHVVVQFKT